MRVQTQARGPYGRIDYSILVLVCCTLASLFFGCKEVSRSLESPSNTETAKKTGVVARTHAEATREKTKAKNPWVEGVTRESQTYSTGRDCELGQPGCRCKMPAYNVPVPPSVFTTIVMARAFLLRIHIATRRKRSMTTDASRI